MPKFIRLTRLYGDKEDPTSQKIIVNLDAIDSARPRKKLKGHRTTLVTRTGTYINVSESFDDIVARIG